MGEPHIVVDRATVKRRRGKTETLILNEISFTVEKGEFICLIGASGCGKTTLLNAIAGFEKLTCGRVEIDGRPVVKPRIEYLTIFQEYGLLPWLSALKNVEFGLKKKGVSKKEREARARKCLKDVGLEGFEERFPAQLSGGQQQRAAIARAFAVNPEILLMDEPFGALDPITRMKLQDDALALAKSEKKTILFVTHDIEEAIYLADRIFVLEPNPGRIKGIVKTSKAGAIDRTSDDFINARNRVFEILGLKTTQSDPIEYYI